MGQYSIKDVETLSGVKAHTLRIWEQRYGFMKPSRTDTNIRYYTDSELRKILNISLLNRNGFKISKIAVMSEAAVRQQVLEIEQAAPTPHNLQDAMVQAMLDFDEKKFEDTLNTALARMQFRQVFSELLFPFLIRAGVLWAVGSIRPAQEHFMSNLIRRKIFAAIDKKVVTPNADSRRFVLFLPEGETHELLLLFTDFVLRDMNHNVIYLGNSVPFDDISYIKEHFKPQYLVSFFTIPLPDSTVQEYVDKLSFHFPEQHLILGGEQLSQQTIILPGNAYKVNSIEELEKVLQQA